MLFVEDSQIEIFMLKMKLQQAARMKQRRMRDSSYHNSPLFRFTHAGFLLTSKLAVP